jgi:hypothetical protein
MVDHRSDVVVRHSGVFDKDKLECFSVEVMEWLMCNSVIKPRKFWNPNV